jgi:hypothetical protein
LNSSLVQLIAKVSRGVAEISLIELFGVLALTDSEGSLAKVGLASRQLSELGLQIIPPIDKGELDSARRIVFADSGLITAETFQEELADRESEALELKSSLFFDYKKAAAGAPKSALKSEEVLHSSLKTIAAFLTSAGGTLFIGIDDKGNILGLHEDYCCMTDDSEKQNADGWELNLRGLIEGRFKDGTSINDYVKCTILEYQKLPVARIKVSQRKKLSFLKQKGSDTYVLYRRQGNQTIAVSIDQVEEFLELRRKSFE